MTDRNNHLLGTDEPPYATLTSLGRGWWRIAIHHGLLLYGPGGCGWTRLGRRRAIHKAQRELARYIKRQHPETILVNVQWPKPKQAASSPPPTR